MLEIYEPKMPETDNLFTQLNLTLNVFTAT